MTMEETCYAGHESVYVAPLRIQKPKRTSSNGSRKSRPRSQHSKNQSQGTQSHSSHQQMTPPPTPSTSQDSLVAAPEPPENRSKSPAFKPFVRAFFPFHPAFSPNSSTVTLPLNAGDLILVHSIHTNGWADGTMLSSGARGWLPTNYCEEYDVDQIRQSLKACISLFDQFKTGNPGSFRVSQTLVGDVVAGVRYLLVGPSSDSLSPRFDGWDSSSHLGRDNSNFYYRRVPNVLHGRLQLSRLAILFANHEKYY